jgi:hypothetical protein
MKKPRGLKAGDLQTIKESLCRQLPEFRGNTGGKFSRFHAEAGAIPDAIDAN